MGISVVNLKKIKQKYKYGGLLRIIHSGFVKIGINLSFFYLVEEGLHLVKTNFEAEEFKDYIIEFLNENDLNSICSIPERPRNKEKLLNAINRGCKCLLVKKDGKIIGYTWFNLNECSFETYNFQLKENEAYLFDAYIIMKYRGKKLAPFIRYRSYQELEELNKTTLYSISDVLNKQSINFKKKLNAKFLCLIFSFNLFKKIKFSRKIKELI